MHRLNKSIHIRPTFTWVDWQLYERAASTNAARVLNETLRDLVNAGCSREEVQRAVEELMAHASFSSVGANDTEPLHFLGQVLNEIYG